MSESVCVGMLAYMHIRMHGCMFVCFLFYLVHPCDKPNKGGCDQRCNKDGDQFNCSCKPIDYILAEDRKSCTKGNIELAFRPTQFHY